MPSIRGLIEYDARHPHKAGSNLEEKLFLFSLLRMIKPERVLEIGVSAGHMTAWLALALQMNGTGKLTSVDNFSMAHGGQAGSPSAARQRLIDNSLAGFVEFVKSDSVEFLKKQESRSFDMVWVDGDHSYAGAKADIVEALRVASKVVGVHDTNQLYTGPREAITNVVGDFDSLDEGPNPSQTGFWVKGCRGIWVVNVDGGVA